MTAASGLRISDAALRQKTGTPVWVPPPPKTVEALHDSPGDNEKYFFWDGVCLPTSAVKIWERTFETLFEKAHIPDGRIHRFRDTFAVELLLKGVPIEQVSVLLGHSSLKGDRETLRAMGEGTSRPARTISTSDLAHVARSHLPHSTMDAKRH